MVFTPERPDKALAFTLTYFAYPAPTVDFLFPDDGPFVGGNTIRIQVQEPSGAETREGAGLPNFLDAAAASLRVVFNNTKPSAQITKTLIGLDRAELRVVVPNSGIETPRLWKQSRDSSCGIKDESREVSDANREIKGAISVQSGPGLRVFVFDFGVYECFLQSWAEPRPCPVLT